MKRIAATLLVMFSLCAVASAQTLASKTKPPRAKRAADGGVKSATPLGREPVLMYFDAETGLFRKQEFAYPGDKVYKLGVVYIDSYATVDGLKVPALFRCVYPDFTMTFRVYEVKHNVSINDALFRDPNAK